jgi:hypothetical protein
MLADGADCLFEFEFEWRRLPGGLADHHRTRGLLPLAFESAASRAARDNSNVTCRQAVLESSPVSSAAAAAALGLARERQGEFGVQVRTCRCRLALPDLPEPSPPPRPRIKPAPQGKGLTYRPGCAILTP